MINILYYFYNFSVRFEQKNSQYVAKVIRRLVKILFDLYTSSSFFSSKFKDIKYEYDKRVSSGESVTYTVSLTSFPARIEYIHLVILSIMNQYAVPEKIILWLSKKQFSELTSLPKNLVSLIGDNFEIRFVDEDFRSFKKYIHLDKTDFTSGFIIMDDDIYYPRYTISNLVKLNKMYPGKVCANRAAYISEGVTYSSWPIIKSDMPEVSRDYMPTGCGGVLYPSDSLDQIAFDAKLAFELAPTADDIWLNFCTNLNKVEVAVSCSPTYFLDLNIHNNETLHHVNVNGNGNDATLERISQYSLDNYGISFWERD